MQIRRMGWRWISRDMYDDEPPIIHEDDQVSFQSKMESRIVSTRLRGDLI